MNARKGGSWCTEGYFWQVGKLPIVCRSDETI